MIDRTLWQMKNTGRWLAAGSGHGFVFWGLEILKIPLRLLPETFL